MKQKIILHLDMDAFFAAIEIRDNPEYKGKPVIIGTKPYERGVVSTCSYEARKYGIHSAMNIKEAYRLCPNGIFITPNMKKYIEVSNNIKKILSNYSNYIESFGLDEAYLDITDSIKFFKSEDNLAFLIKAEIFEKEKLTCSIGIGYNKLTAKLASEYKKPNGYFKIMNQEEFDNIFINKPVSILYGVGKKTEAILNKYNIYTINDLRKYSLPFLKMILKSYGEELYKLCRGIDDRELILNHEEKSIGYETTFQKDTKDFNKIKKILIEMLKKIVLHLKKNRKCARTIRLKIKYFNMKVITKSFTLSLPTNNVKIFYEYIIKLLNLIDKSKPIRLVGVSVTNITKNLLIQRTFDMLDKTNNNLTVKK